MLDLEKKIVAYFESCKVCGAALFHTFSYLTFGVSWNFNVMRERGAGLAILDYKLSKVNITNTCLSL